MKFIIQKFLLFRSKLDLDGTRGGRFEAYMLFLDFTEGAGGLALFMRMPPGLDCCDSLVRLREDRRGIVGDTLPSSFFAELVNLPAD